MGEIVRRGSPHEFQYRRNNEDIVASWEKFRTISFLICGCGLSSSTTTSKLGLIIFLLKSQKFSFHILGNFDFSLEFELHKVMSCGSSGLFFLVFSKPASVILFYELLKKAPAKSFKRTLFFHRLSFTPLSQSQVWIKIFWIFKLVFKQLRYFKYLNLFFIGYLIGSNRKKIKK